MKLLNYVLNKQHFRQQRKQSNQKMLHIIQPMLQVREDDSGTQQQFIYLSIS